MGITGLMMETMGATSEMLAYVGAISLIVPVEHNGFIREHCDIASEVVIESIGAGKL
jgi:hypothetical protein